MTTQATNTPAPGAVADPVTLLRSRQYLQLLVIAAVLGVPISAVAYGYLVLSTQLQGWLYQDLPGVLGLDRGARLVAAAPAGSGRTAGRTRRSVRAGSAAGSRRSTASTRAAARRLRSRCWGSPSLHW